MVLADDNFASIVAAVREGRTVYDNIRKVIGWTLPTDGGEALTIVLAIAFGLTLPIYAGADPLGQHGDQRSRSA